MKMPEVGHSVYAFQNIEDRIGETMFLASTQEHVTTNLQEGEGECLEEICFEGFTIIDGEDIPSYDSSKASNLIIWEMKRIK